MKFKDLPAGSLFVYGRRSLGSVLSTDVQIKLTEALQHAPRKGASTTRVAAMTLSGEHKDPPDEAVVSPVAPDEGLIVRIREGRSFGSLSITTGLQFFVWASVTQVHHAELRQVCWPARPQICDHGKLVARNMVSFDGNTYRVEPADRIAMVTLDGSFVVVDERATSRSGSSQSSDLETSPGGLVIHRGPLPPGWRPPT